MDTLLLRAVWLLAVSMKHFVLDVTTSDYWLQWDQVMIVGTCFLFHE